MKSINSESSKAWDSIVGSQTPAEFMKMSKNQTIEQAVAEYVKDLPRMFPDYQKDSISEDYSDSELLEYYIEHHLD